MARRKVRKLGLQPGKRSRHCPRPGRGRGKQAASAGARSAAAQPAAPQPLVCTKQDLAAKLIPLTVPSARDASKNAEKTIDNVFSAVRHVLSEGDLAIPDFGELKAVRGTKGKEIIIRFTPHDKLKQAAEARMN